jgi:uncharacterized ParB-like nuclease family protein
MKRSAQRLYQKYNRPKTNFWHKRTGKQSKLLELKNAGNKAKFTKQAYLGIKEIAVEMIKGSEGRVNNFAADFRLVNSTEEMVMRWQSIAQAELSGESLPPVQLIQVGKVYYVRDGHHRISVAKALGRATVDAEVTLWLP